jgi:pimeloyl-ACP methyl ester carboxylesterase
LIAKASALFSRGPLGRALDLVRAAAAPARSQALDLALSALPDLPMSWGHAIAHRGLVAQGAEQWTSLLAGHRVQRYALRGRGTGPAVLLVHGLNGAASSMAPLLPAVLELASRVVLIDLPQHGRSPAPAEPLSAIDYARVVVAAVDELAEETGGKVVLIGNSMGGGLSLLAASERPALVAGVIGLNPAGAPNADAVVGELPRSFPSPAEGARTMAGLLFLHPPPLFWLVARDLARTWASPMVQKILADSAAGKNAASTALVLRDLKAPVLVLWGEHDGLLPRSSLEDFRTIPGAQLELIPECGHMPQLEQPKLVRERVRAFLAGLPK